LQTFHASVDFELAEIESQLPIGMISSHTAAVVFTNRLARQGFCLVLRLGQKIFSREPFTTVASDNYILTSNPLAQRESLALALQKAASLFPPSGASYTLIVKSHGTPYMALMPRLSVT
jgi:hypothetical protein